MPNASRLKSSITFNSRILRPVLQLAVHEVHRPYRIHRCRYDQRLRRLPHKPFAMLDAQVQFQFSVNPVHALMAPAETLHIAQVPKTQPKAPIAMIVGQPCSSDLEVLKKI